MMILAKLLLQHLISVQVASCMSTLWPLLLQLNGSLNGSNFERLVSGRSIIHPSSADIAFGDRFGGILFSSGKNANEAVQDQLAALSFTRF
ncbi:hypothetical protein C5167_019161 [Papaver somniferum]|uniref:Legume lectin domain-containing protein n=1 Tax=Papaver somniferum TaxID=3469 RepID=A0A4Y7ITC4_PAPSO|nr:hypothetical protein C5167_019161 [Papaver somniferum]